MQIVSTSLVYDHMQYYTGFYQGNQWVAPLRKNAQLQDLAIETERFAFWEAGK